MNQFQQLNSALISGFPIVSMGEAIDTVRQIAIEETPPGYAFDYSGASRQFIQEGTALWVTFGLALAIIFLVLAAQFESFRDPLVILVTVPLSICGALIPLFLGWSSMNIYTQVGLVTLIGLISKHGILIVEFANQSAQGQGPDASPGRGRSRGDSPAPSADDHRRHGVRHGAADPRHRRRGREPV